MRPGLLYLVSRGAPGPLYVSLTNRCHTTHIISSRGPGFAFGSKFVWLEKGFEPSADEIFDSISSARTSPAFDEWDGKTVVFAGGGEPLLRAKQLSSACRMLRNMDTGTVPGVKVDKLKEDIRYGSFDIRVVTNGLFPRSLVRSALQGNVSRVSVAMNGHEEATYRRIMQPLESDIQDCLASNASFLGSSEDPLSSGQGNGSQQGGGALSVVQDFVLECKAADIEVELTCVEAPGVDIPAVEAFARSHGASFRARSYFS